MTPKRYSRGVSKLSLPKQRLRSVLKYSQFVAYCYLCGVKLTEETFTFDHVIPTSKGGTNAWSNIRCCCYNCNQEKGNRDYEEFVAVRYAPKVRFSFSEVWPSSLETSIT